MPVVGLPTTLEVTLDALLQHNRLTSWKVSGEGDSTVIVMRMKTSPATNNMASEQLPNNSLPQCFRKNPPSQQARDRKRAQERRQAAASKSEASNSNNLCTSQTLFMPTPPKSHAGLHTDTASDPDDTPPHANARETRLEATLNSVWECSGRAEQQNSIDLLDVAPKENTTMCVEGVCEEPAEEVDESSDSNNTIKDYVAELTDRSLQRKLRHTGRNTEFCGVFSSDDSPGVFICESDDVVIQYDWTGASYKPDNYFWFVKRDTKQMTHEELDIYSKLLLWAPADRERIRDWIDAGVEDLHVVMDAIRCILG